LMDGLPETPGSMEGSVTPDPAAHDHAEMRLSPFGRLFRFLGWWLGFTGLYATFSVCPFCGQPGCPVGMASAGTVGAFLALCMQDWKRLLAFLRGKWIRRKRREVQ
jgi:hypothetical protein